MSGFANPIIGGGGSLVYPSIHSPNYVPGTSGWTIKKDGSVEFNNGTFRGTIINGSVLSYSPSPGKNNLVSSSGIASSFTDTYGNKVISGNTTYFLNTGVYYAISMTGGTIQFYDAGAGGDETTGWILRQDLQAFGGTLALGLAGGLMFPSQSPAPAAGTSAIAFGLGGQFRVIDAADGNNYTTERLSIIASHTTLINSLAEIDLTDLTVPVSASRTYRVEGMVIGINGANAATQAVGIDGPAASNCNIDVDIRSATAGTYKNFGEITALGGRVGTGNLAGAERFVARYSGDITFSSAGNLVLTGSCVTLAADTWTAQNRSFLEVMPV